MRRGGKQALLPAASPSPHACSTKRATHGHVPLLSPSTRDAPLARKAVQRDLLYHPCAVCELFCAPIPTLPSPSDGMRRGCDYASKQRMVGASAYGAATAMLPESDTLHVTVQSQGTAADPRCDPSVSASPLGGECGVVLLQWQISPSGGASRRCTTSPGAPRRVTRRPVAAPPIGPVDEMSMNRAGETATHFCSTSPNNAQPEPGSRGATVCSWKSSRSHAARNRAAARMARVGAIKDAPLLEGAVKSIRVA
mmetsp:Transcript_27603/g.84051  ORF Transcript_27603/g.84051 Transcript_27603/m.84051 type:complete len:253 (+) Transcript_27603:111-869(+)|eukprot:scaffold45453_cov32-Tisochrysis_lutea.AAC.5